MRLKALIPAGLWWLVCGLSLASAAHAQSDAPKPFSARYQVQWHSITVGTSDLILKQLGSSGEYEYTSKSNARGIFRIAFSDEITQTSRLMIKDGRVQPLNFRGDDGTPSTKQDVTLDFDWQALRVKGVSEDKPVNIPLQPDTQDPMSVQISLMVALANGHPPTLVRLADKDEIKDFQYVNEGRATINTALGDLDTIVLSSHRAGTSRVMRLWFAPSLGYLPVQAQRSKDGKVEFSMMIKSLQR
jgi:hypothetical protein